MYFYKPIFILFIVAFLLLRVSANAQRNYVNSSVLSTGNWFKIAVNTPGVYKLDIAFLSKLGINTTNLSSASVKLYGNGGGPLPEKPNQ